MPPPIPKEEWLVRFVNELVLYVKPAYPDKYAQLIAANQWPIDHDKNPGEAARAWHANRQK